MKKLISILFILSTILIYGQNIPTNGLVAYYPFNGNANDESGNGYNGTVNGPTLTTDRNGVSNSAYEFDGGWDYIDVPHSPALNPTTTGYSISVWVNIYPGFSVGDIVRKMNDSYTENFGMRYHDPNAYPGYGLNISTQRNYVDYWANISSVPLNQWQHVVGTYDGTKLKIYLNGNLITTGATFAVPNQPYNNTANFQIGATNYPFKGKIDDIAVYNRELTLEEINYLYSGQNQSQSDTVLVHSSSHDFFSAWREDWAIDPAKTYLLKISGIFGGAGGQPEFDAAFRLASPNPPMNEFWSASFRPRRPDNDVYNLEHTYYYTLNEPSGLIWIAFGDPVYGDNSGTMYLSLYELRESGNTGSFSNWKMQINTTVQNLYDQLNHAGVDSLATEGYDPALDTPNPPTPPGNYIDAYFYHPEWNSPLGAKFASDVKQSTDLADTVKRWFFEVESNVTNQDVTLTFVGSDIPSNFGKYLKDMQTGERVNLKNTNTYTYFNTSTSPRKFQLIIGDSTAPAISDLIPKGDEIWRSNTQKQISWTMSDGTGIDSVFLFVSNDNGTLFNPLVSLGNISNYNWNVFQEYLNNGYRVKVEVRDSLGNMSDITSPLAFTVVGDSLANTSPIGWSLFSTPLEPFNVAKSSIFDDDITNNPYFIWGYSLADGYTLASDINFGTGYWLGLIAQAEWDVTGTAVEADTIAQPLGLGYNILGTRYVRPVKKDDLRFIKEGQYLNFTEATTAGWITNAIYGYSGGGYNSVDQLDLFSGYWLAALTSGVQMVQRPGTTLPSTPPSLNPLSMTAENWNIDFTVETETLRDRSLFLGVSETATIGFDNQFDAPRPPTPPAGDYLEMYSEVTGSNYPQFLGNKYAIDYKPLEAAAWNLKVKKGTSSSQLVTIKWNRSQLATLPDTIAVKLTDMTTGQQIDMKVDSTYSFTYNGERNFAVNTSLTDIGSESEIPTEFVLNQNYPNPFNPSTTVRYSIPRESRVILTLFNSLGEAVSVVRDEVLNSGWYQSEIKADDLPSGIYFMRLEATSSNNKFVQTIKMILLK